MFKIRTEIKRELGESNCPPDTISSSKIFTNDERRKNRQPLTPKLKWMLGLLAGILISGVIAYATHDPLAITVVNVLIIITGLWMLVSALRRMGRSLASYRWVPCDYTVSDTHFTLIMGYPDQYNQYTPRYRLNYAYENLEYSVTSEDELDQHVRYVFATPHQAQQYLSQLVEEARTGKLYVNPHKPEEAFLRRGINRGEVGLLIFSLMLITLPILTMLGIIVWHSGTV